MDSAGVRSDHVTENAMTSEQRTESHEKVFDADEGRRVSVLKTDLSLALETLRDGDLSGLAGQLQGLLDCAKPV